MAFYSYLSTKIIIAFITKSYQDLFGVRSYINALYYSDGYTFIIEYPSVSGRYFYGTAEDGFEIRLEWVDGRSIRKK